MSSQPTQLNGKQCSTPECGKPLRARGFCSACYYRHLRHGDLVSGTPTQGWKHRLTDIDLVNKTATCAFCGKVSIISRGKDQWRCATDAHNRSKLYKRAYRASKKAEMLDHCEICNSTKNLCWDHDHSLDTPVYRGTLCRPCNLAIGFLRDNQALLHKAKEYLATH